MPRPDPPVHSRFKKGKSGNPRGRTPKTETQKELAAVIKAYLNETDSKEKSNLRKQIEKLARLKTEKGSRLLLEYGFGKVPQPVVGDKDRPLKVQVEFVNDWRKEDE